jgi:hypothetical protein
MLNTAEPNVGKGKLTFDATSQPMLFIVRAAFLAFLPSAAVVCIVARACASCLKPYWAFYSGLEAIFVVCVISPLGGTVIGQWLPITVASFFTRKRWLLVAASALTFLLEHPYGLANTLTLIAPSIAFAWSFVVQKEISGRRAFWITAGAHGLYNLGVLGLHLLVLH